MQYNIYINTEFKDRIDPVLIETIEKEFKARIRIVSKTIKCNLYGEYKNIYLIKQ